MNEKVIDWERVRAKFEQRIGSQGHGNMLGIKFGGVGRGWAECWMDWRADLVGDPETGIMASGPIISLMDVCCGVSLHTLIPGIASSVTLELKVDYLRPGRPGRRITGRGEVYHVTRQIAFVRGMAHDGEPDRPIANVTGSFIYTKKDS